MTNAEQQYDISERDAVRADLEREARDDAATVAAERFGPLPQREPGVAGKRLQFIAVLHAMIQFLIDNPDLPCPWTASMSFTVSDTLALEAIAERFADAGVECRAMRNAHGVLDQVTLFEAFGPDFYTPVSFRAADPLHGRPL
jgi:hypothetical protein